MEVGKNFSKGLFILFLFSGIFFHEAKAQKGAQLLFGLDAYSWNRTPSLDSNHTHVSSGNIILNPNVSFSMAWGGVLSETFFITNAGINYSITSFSLGKNPSFGSINFPLSAGIGFYESKGTYIQLLYGYQFTLTDLYHLNKDFPHKDLNFNTHTIELGCGLGDDDYLFSLGCYLRLGFNFSGAFTINSGVRFGIPLQE